MERNPDLYLEKFNAAQDTIKDVMSSEETAQVIKELREEYSITGENAGDLAYVVGTVLLGMTHPKDFIKTLESGLGVSHEDAVAMAKKINSDIYAPVKKQLIAVHDIKAKNVAAQPDKNNAEESPVEDDAPIEEQEKEEPKEIHNKPLPTPPAPPAAPAPRKPGDDPYRESID